MEAKFQQSRVRSAALFAIAYFGVMSTKEHKHRANLHELRFWSQVQGELIRFCHAWCRGDEQSRLYDLAIDLDRIVKMTPEDPLISPHQAASRLVYQLFS
jgi:hypothetical protein